MTTTASRLILFWSISAPMKLAPLEMPTPAPAARQLTGHEDNVAVVDGDVPSSSPKRTMSG